MTYSRYALSGLAFLGMTLMSTDNAQAQGRYNNPNVSVDMSVLDDNGISVQAAPNAPNNAGVSPTGSSYLLMPSPNTPVSTFSPLPETVILTKPQAEPAQQQVSTFTPPPMKAAAPQVAAKAEEPPAAPKVKLTQPAKMTAPKPMAKPKAIEVGKPISLPKAPQAVQLKGPDMPPAAPKMKMVDAPPPPPAVKKPSVTQESLPAPQVEKKPQPVKVAALTPKTTPKAATGSKEGLMTIGFESTSSKLSAAAKEVLSPMANDLKDETGKRLQILAYAGGEALSPSRARRLSLSRALAVRSYLIDQGLRSTRIDVRALGSKVPDGDPNRVDLKVIAR